MLLPGRPSQDRAAATLSMAAVTVLVARRRICRWLTGTTAKTETCCGFAAVRRWVHDHCGGRGHPALRRDRHRGGRGRDDAGRGGRCAGGGRRDGGGAG